MHTFNITTAPTSEQLAEIAAILNDGGVVLMPTDTIYGLHALATDERAVGRIAEMKGRDDRKPLLVLASSIDDLTPLGVTAPRETLAALDEIWPGPLTAILPLAAPVAASRGSATVGVRIPDLAWLRELVRVTGPLASTSANRSGEPPVERPSDLAFDLQRSLDAVVDGGLRRGEPSAILDLTGDEPRFIRESHSAFTQKVWKTLWKSL